MELRQEPHRRQAPARASQPARWFVHAQGRTLGPLSEAEIVDGLRAGDFLASDRVYSPKDGSWTALESHPAFMLVARRPRASDLLFSPPSPRRLRMREAEPISVHAEIPELPQEAAAAPAATPEPAFEPLPLPVAVAAEAPEVIPETIPETIPEPAPAPPPEPQREAAPVAALPLPPAPEPVPEPLPTPAVQAAPLPEPSPFETRPELAAIPPRPELRPVFLADPPPRWDSEPEKKERLTLRIELKLPERPLRLLLLALAVIGLAFWVGGRVPSRETPNKTRDQKDFRLSDPSSPTTAPSEAGDPIPPLKAPTRPQRE